MKEAWSDKRDHLIRAAIGVISRFGIKKTALEDIAKASGLATSSLYYYFPSKDNLVKVALSSISNKLLEEVEEIASSLEHPKRKLIAVLKSPFSSAHQSGLMVNLDAMTRSEVLHMSQDIVEDFRRRYTIFIKCILEQGKTEGIFAIKDPDLTSTAISAGFMGLFFNTADKEHFKSIVLRIDELIEILLNGLSTNNEFVRNN